jgi:hypothetical protein
MNRELEGEEVEQMKLRFGTEILNSLKKLLIVALIDRSTKDHIRQLFNFFRTCE